MITTVRLVVLSLSPIVTFSFSPVVIAFKIYSLNNIQVYSPVLLIIVTMLCTRSQISFILKLEVCTLWPTSRHFPYPPAPDNHHSTLLVLWVHCFKYSTYNWEHIVFVFLYLKEILLTMISYNSFRILEFTVWYFCTNLNKRQEVLNTTIVVRTFTLH